MKIAVIKESALNEYRCAISPEMIKHYLKNGFIVAIEKDAGINAGYTNQAFQEAGAEIADTKAQALAEADIILKVQPSTLENQENELSLAKKGAVIIGILSPSLNQTYIDNLAQKQLTAIAMELVPRITRAQNIDVLSSQSNLAGYRAVIEASYHFNKAFPMMMTAAGTIVPAKVLILGIGVAGLQAIATAKRLGAVVSAYDVRNAVKEQVESLGAKFVAPNQSVNLETSAGYASEASTDYQHIQSEFFKSIINNYDIIIGTAQIPGKKAPLLISKEMLKLMKPSSVIVDMATSSGGNIEGSKSDEIVRVDGVTIIGWANLASRIAADSSKLYAKNLASFLNLAIKDNKFNFEDEIVKQMVIVKDGVKI